MPKFKIHLMRLLMEAAELRIEANKLPRGRARDALLQRADKIERSAIIEGWVNSPGLRTPEERNDKAHHKPHLETGRH
jgi:hypothetical protein